MQFNVDEISLFEPQCIVKDDDSDMDENLDFYSDENNCGDESSAHHFLEIAMSQNNYNPGTDEDDPAGVVDLTGHDNGLLDESAELGLPEGKGWVCAQCSCTFARRHDLRQHYEVHKNETTFKCIYCDKEFSKRKYLTRHARRHIKKTKFNCLTCDRFFDSATELESHNCDHSNSASPLPDSLGLSQIS